MTHAVSNAVDRYKETGEIRQRINDLLADLPDRAARAHDPQARALLEMTREVLRGIVTTYDHYETQSEAPFQ